MSVAMPKKNKLNPDSWFDNHYKFLYNYAFSRIGHEDKVKDLVQETFIAALGAMKNYRSAATERTWLVSILKHKIIDYYRFKNTKKYKAEKRMLSHDEYYDFYFKEAATVSGSETAFEYEQNQKQLAGLLRESIERLPKKQARVIEMKYLLDYDTETICEMLDISKNNVWVLVYRAKKNMASDLHQYRCVI